MRLGIVGYSSSGKSTLIEKIIERLSKEGYKIGAVKHTSEKRLDKEGKDTERFSKAGAIISVGAASNETAFFIENEMNIEDICKMIENIVNLDVILFEGYKESDLPKVVLGKGNFKNVVMKYEDNLEDILRYIKEEVDFERVLKRLPNTNCGKCGRTCIETARFISKGKFSITECKNIDAKKVKVTVNGKEIPLNKFASDIIAGTVLGAVGSLKGVEKIVDLKIQIDNSPIIIDKQ
ncbi:MAG: molybdopterin-guanine dinucleotide biosynthesis protein B [Thermoplasmata archaeon]